MTPHPNTRPAPNQSAEAAPAGDSTALPLTDPTPRAGANVVNRTPGGRFRPGCSGNPAGRPRTESAALRRQLAEHADDIVHAVLDAARSGDMAAAKMVLDRILPPLSHQSESIPISMEAPAGPAATAAAILDAAVAGKISPDAAAQLLSAAASLSRIVETEELKFRLEALERAVTPPKPSPGGAGTKNRAGGPGGH